MAQLADIHGTLITIKQSLDNIRFSELKDAIVMLVDIVETADVSYMLQQLTKGRADRQLTFQIAEPSLGHEDILAVDTFLKVILDRILKPMAGKCDDDIPDSFKRCIKQFCRYASLCSWHKFMLTLSGIVRVQRVGRDNKE